MKPGELVTVVDSEHSDVPCGTTAKFQHPLDGGFVVEVNGSFKDPYDGRFYPDTRTVFVLNVVPITS